MKKNLNPQKTLLKFFQWIITQRSVTVLFTSHLPDPPSRLGILRAITLKETSRIWSIVTPAGSHSPVPTWAFIYLAWHSDNYSCVGNYRREDQTLTYVLGWLYGWGAPRHGPPPDTPSLTPSPPTASPPPPLHHTSSFWAISGQDSRPKCASVPPPSPVSGLTLLPSLMVRSGTALFA